MTMRYNHIHTIISKRVACGSGLAGGGNAIRPMNVDAKPARKCHIQKMKLSINIRGAKK